MPRAPRQIRAQAIELRAQQTSAEAKLWHYLRARKLEGHKFRRQHPIDRFIVDFCCLECHLVVELDGPIHQQQRERDEERTQALEYMGYRVVRWPNDVILSDIDAVLAALRNLLSNGA